VRRTLYFVRHGETHWNVEGRFQGRLESDLTPRGEAQARTTAETVASLGVDAIVASPLRRARRSAEILADVAGLPLTIDERLAEWDAGEWSGHLRADIEARWPEAWAAWRADPWTVGAPGGETFADLEARGRAALEPILAGPAARTAIVSHGFLGRATLGALLGLDRRTAARLRAPNDTFFRCQRDDRGWRCDRFDATKGPLPPPWEE